ncbi:MAG TPA: exodeoxyribonuclease VII small subunit [bacterium]|jgi:exodeoxyribonuclease VII small subunit
MAKKSAAPPEKSFEETIKRLEEIVHSLEGQTPSLDESLQLFEEGKSLLTQCLAKLESAEQKLRILSKDNSS